MMFFSWLSSRQEFGKGSRRSKIPQRKTWSCFKTPGFLWFFYRFYSGFIGFLSCFLGDFLSLGPYYLVPFWGLCVDYRASGRQIQEKLWGRFLVASGCTDYDG